MTSLVRSLVAAVAAVLMLMNPSPASAHDARIGSFPAAGETLTSSYREFVLPSAGAEEPAQVSLLDLRSGSEVPPSRPPVLRRGQTVWFPPTLDHGTYLLEWEFVADGTVLRDRVHFEVSRPSHEVLLLPGAQSEPLLLAAAALVLALAVLSQRRPHLRWLILAPAALPLLLPLLSGTPAHASWALRAAPLLFALLAGFVYRAVPVAAAAAAAALAVVPQGGAYGLVLLVLLTVVLSAPVAAFSPERTSRLLVLGVLAAVPLLFVRFGSGLFAPGRAPVLLGVSLLIAGAAVAYALGRGVPSVLRGVLSAGVVLWAAAVMAPPHFLASPVAGVIEEPSTCFARGDYLSVQRCLEVSFSSATFDEGVRTALTGLDGLLREVPQARFHCHAASHAIGRAAFDLAGDVPSAFRSGFDVCDFGFFHGVIEAAAAGMDDEGFSEVVSSACTPLLEDGELFFLQCAHGVGHAAARRTNNDMLAGLEFCDLLRDAPMPERMRQGALNGCGTGVTMEWFAVTGLVQDPATVAAPAVSRQRDVCFLVPERWQPECFEYVGNTLDASRPEESLLELAGWCAGSPFPSDCALGLMRAAAGTSVAPAGALRVCGVAVPDRVEDCVFEFLVTVATTIDYTPSSVDVACSALPPEFSSGQASVCDRAREESADVLAAGGTLLPG